MKRSFMMGILIFGLALAAPWGVAQAQYRPPAATRPESSLREENDFDRSVDLRRFRKGKPEWDTQELIASGMKALHQDQVEILRQLRELQAAVDRLEKKK